MSEDKDKEIFREVAGVSFDNTLSQDEEQYAFNAGNAKQIYNALNEVIKMAEVGLMTQKEKIEVENDREIYMKRQATCIFLLKMLNEGIKEEIPDEKPETPKEE